MMKNVDKITNKNHPSKKLNGDILALSKAYHVTNSTVRNSEFYDLWKLNWLDERD